LLEFEGGFADEFEVMWLLEPLEGIVFSMAIVRVHDEFS